MSESSYEILKSFNFLSKAYSIGVSNKESTSELKRVRERLLMNPFGLPDENLRNVSDFFENFAFPEHPVDRIDDNMAYYSTNYKFVALVLLSYSNLYASIFLLLIQYLTVIVPINSMFGISVAARLALIHGAHIILCLGVCCSALTASLLTWVTIVSVIGCHAFFRTRSKIRVTKSNILNAVTELIESVEEKLKS
eukprot:GDKJ01013522.1.p1 GENE.GDKJ01013522.1~~GDKJ01013522.1.p1  ORF type:complete len:195 (-),score=18.32 GDKJ01013522.1:32-616(-)